MNQRERIQELEAQLAHAEGIIQALRDHEVDAIVGTEDVALVRLRQAEEKHAILAAIIESSEDAIISRDLDGTVTSWNAGAQHIYGYRPDEMIGQPNGRIIPSELQAEEATFLERVQRGESIAHYETVRLTKDGRRIPVSLTISPIRNAAGAIIGASKIVRDITERKRAEEEISKTNQRLTALMKALPVGVSFSNDANCRHVSGNSAVLAQFAVGPIDNLSASAPHSDAPGRRIRYFVHGREITEADLPLQRAVAEQREIPPMELEVHLPDGRRWFTEASGAPIRDAQGNVTGGVAVTVDITARKQAEERLKHSLQEKEVMLKEIHHRVKNNLQVISSLVDLQAATLDPALRGQFREVRDRVRSMALVHEKLYQSENLARVEFSDYARSLLTYLWRAHGSGTARIRLTLDLQPVSLSVEKAVPCGLILNELAVNALKHAFAGRAEGEVTVALHTSAEGRVSLRVRDNGVGLPAELDWRESPSLGLRLVQMLAGQLHGTVQAVTGAGTEFVIEFAHPRAETSTTATHD